MLYRRDSIRAVRIFLPSTVFRATGTHTCWPGEVSKAQFIERPTPRFNPLAARYLRLKFPKPRRENDLFRLACGQPPSPEGEGRAAYRRPC